ncbi:MAG: alpha/beta fold hydrolase [Opitutaceae bacterium]|nr:alpha/beta fold hydrolase [Opitutaceae bacterium]
MPAILMPTAVASPRTFDLALPDLALARGGVVRHHRSRGWWWSREGDTPEAPQPNVPTVLLVHALTGSAQAGGPDGWWEPMIGPGRPLDPAQYRLVCFNNLGSCYGSSGPGVDGFPSQADLTTLDISRAILQALDHLGIRRLHLTTGGSLGGMVTLTLAALAPERFERLLPIATSLAASAWVVGWNHVAREILRLDPGYPHQVTRGLEIARQLAMLTYRAEAGLDQRQPRSAAGQTAGAAGYPVQSYLEHQGAKLRRRFAAQSYELQLAAMDHHDLRQPLPGETAPAVSRIRASSLVIDVDSDQLFTPAQAEVLTQHLRAAGARVERATLRSIHGHDAFLMEWDTLAPIVTRALHLEVPGR